MKKFFVIVLSLCLIFGSIGSVFAAQNNVYPLRFNFLDGAQDNYSIAKGELCFLRHGCTIFGNVQIRRPADTKWTTINSNETSIATDVYILPLTDVFIEYRESALTDPANIKNIETSYVKGKIIIATWPKDTKSADTYDHYSTLNNFNYPLVDLSIKSFTITKGEIIYLKYGYIVSGKAIKITTLGAQKSKTSSNKITIKEDSYVEATTEKLTVVVPIKYILTISSFSIEKTTLNNEAALATNGSVTGILTASTLRVSYKKTTDKNWTVIKEQKTQKFSPQNRPVIKTKSLPKGDYQFKIEAKNFNQWDPPSLTWNNAAKKIINYTIK